MFSNVQVELSQKILARETNQENARSKELNCNYNS